jgi:hypothetical protein
MKRRRSGMPRGTFRTTTPTWSGRARRSTPIRGRRRRQKLEEDDNLNLSWSLETLEKLPAYQPHPGGDQLYVPHHEGEVKTGAMVKSSKQEMELAKYKMKNL